MVTELKNRADAIYAAKEKEFTPPIMREVERVVLLRNVDQEWMDTSTPWNSCRTASACGLRPAGPGGGVPPGGFDMFDSMIAAIRENTAKMMLTVRLRKKEAGPQREPGGPKRPAPPLPPLPETAPCRSSR